MSTIRVVTVVGARPQFVKAAAVSRAIAVRNETAEAPALMEVVVHSGQHYDRTMSDLHFEQLGLSQPAHHLEVGSAGHGAQTGLMLQRLEPILSAEAPDWVLVYGDTNTTLAGALAAAKLNLQLAHVEAGLRSHRRDMPEEVNRVVTDHVSDLLLCPSDHAVSNLQTEGIADGVHLVGDVMHDVLRWQLEHMPADDPVGQLGVTAGQYVFVTVHRAANTDEPDRLAAITKALGLIAQDGVDVVFPVHPRTRPLLGDLQELDRLHLLEPVGYEQSVALAASARAVVTDSGGLQKEAYWTGTPCVTLREETEWPETVEVGWNVLVGADTASIVSAVERPPRGESRPDLYGDGRAAGRIVDLLLAAGSR